MRKSLVTAIAALAIMGLTAQAEAQTYTAKVVKVGGDEETPENLALLRFKQIVEQRTKGDVALEVFIGTQLGDEVAIAEGMRLGSVQGGLLTSQAMSQWVPQGDVWSLPFIFETSQDALKAVTGEPGEMVKQYYEDQGYHVVGLWTAGARNPVGHYEIKTVEDAKGKKVRVKQSQLAIDIWNAVGANPTPLPWPDVANAIETKTIDIYTTLGSAWLGMKLYESAPVFSQIDHTWVVYVLSFSKSWWDKLPPEYQEIMEEAAYEMAIFQHHYLNYFNIRGPEIAAQLGGTVVKVEDKSPWIEAMSSIWNDWAAEVDGGQALIDAIQAQN
ncbi:TRAP transporter substrate-binding protein [Acuticoccus sp. M5D2P5]|uniref:TRAP transporter substrate-binding protein n=1 Tax=Acuticoccus kalidii TaxID=2910977 RepID=UPI001F4476D9|nr:TRAP transporter substrate-binding protein [Acuticoccus kalidii]MCF3933446.1 TRAP transporter substrate-binding protein [Acuticoccus kalidii]